MRKLRLPRWFLNLVSSIYVCPRLFWLMYHPQLHRIKGWEARRVINSLQAGDVMVRRWNGYLNSFFTPGYWAHAGLYVGSNEVIHALGDGVVKEDILDFCRTDSIAVLRPSSGDAKAAVEKAMTLIGRPYDYGFRSGNAKYYCSELCDVCYENMFKADYSVVAGNHVLTPGGIYGSARVVKIIEFRH